MVTDSESYDQLIGYLTEHLALFEKSDDDALGDKTIIELIEEELATQIMTVCNQNKSLTVAQRSTIIREIDSIVYDLEEIFSNAVNNKVTHAQSEFIKEFAILIKNIFDSEIHNMD